MRESLRRGFVWSQSISRFLLTAGEKIAILHWGNSINHCNQAIKGNPISVGHTDILNPWYFPRRTHHFCGTPDKNAQPQCNDMKT